MFLLIAACVGGSDTRVTAHDEGMQPSGDVDGGEGTPWRGGAPGAAGGVDAGGDTGDEPPEEGRADAFLYGAETLDLGLELSDEAIAGLATDRDADVPDVPGTFVYGDERYEVGVRLRGGHGSFRTFDDKPGFAIDFDTFVEGQAFRGVRELTLKNMVQDDSMLAEHLALGLFAARGVPAPRHGYARLHVNGEWYGLYATIEALDTREFLDRAYGTDAGTLWEGKMDDVRVDMVDGYEVAVDGGLTDPYGPLHDLATALDGASAETLLGVLEERTEVDTLLDHMAVELVIGNPDSYVTWTNNYYLHLHPVTGRLGMVAWGPDRAFEEPLSVTGAYVGRLYEDCRVSPGCADLLQARIREVSAELSSPEFLAWVDAEAARTEADCTGDPRSDGGAEGCAEGRAELAAFLEDRPNQIVGELGGI